VEGETTSEDLMVGAREDIEEAAFRRDVRYWAQLTFIDAGGAILVSPEAGEAF
jgi:hypothetical protein